MKTIPPETSSGKKPTQPSAGTQWRLSMSIRWRLQFWHAAILIVVVAGLSTAWYIQARRTQISEIDAELLAGARVLDGSLRGFEDRDFGAGDTPLLNLSPDENRRLTLPRSTTPRAPFKAEPYFAIWLNDGRLLKSERTPGAVEARFKKSLRGSRPEITQHAAWRELRIVGPFGSQILVGRDTGHESAQLNRLAFQIAAVGTGILALAFMGGWWLSRSVLHPISAMSETASRFSLQDTSPRIDVTATGPELGQLAVILNAAFDRIASSFDQQRQFAADASHELRTPLAVIQSQIELALRQERSPETYVKTLKTCGSACDRLSELVDSLLTLAHLDSGENQMGHVAVRLDHVVAKCVDLLRPVAESMEVQLRPCLEPAIVMGDARQLEHAILNLLKNSIAYNRPNGRVDLVLEVTQQASQLIIRDTGIGIAQEDIPHVVKRFYRADKARSRQHGGNGLGLAIADTIVRAHSGTMSISSELGKGTTVLLRLIIAKKITEF